MSSNPFRNSKNTKDKTLNTFSSKKGKSAFFKNTEIKPNGFKQRLDEPQTIVKTYNINDSNFPLLSLKDTEQKQPKKFDSLFKENEAIVPYIEESNDIDPGWISINKYTRHITRNKEDQDYYDYLNRSEDDRDNDRDNDGEDDGYLLNSHQLECLKFDNFIQEMKYQRIVNKLTKLYERHCEEDELRGYPRDVDVIQSWEIDHYLEGLQWKKKWIKMEEDFINGIISENEEEETEYSDLEY